MEPGLRDREYPVRTSAGLWSICWLQWSPVLETGNTQEYLNTLVPEGWAAMEPGLRDREYQLPSPPTGGASKKLQWSPVLETGNTCRVFYPLPRI